MVLLNDNSDAINCDSSILKLLLEISKCNNSYWPLPTNLHKIWTQSKWLPRLLCERSNTLRVVFFIIPESKRKPPLPVIELN